MFEYARARGTFCKWLVRFNAILADNDHFTGLDRADKFCADNIRRFHEAQRPQEMWMKEIRPGVLVGERATPIDSVALYSPRGKGTFPSMTLMTAIPAVVAGVPMPIVLTPPGPDGKVDAATLVAARIAGVKHVYKAGGGQAVAAAAFGTDTVPRCAKFEGPGSPWIAAAKRNDMPTVSGTSTLLAAEL